MIAKRHELALFVYGTDRRLLASANVPPDTARRVALAKARASVLAGHRFVQTVGEGREVLVGVPLSQGRVGAMLALSERQDIPQTLGIVRRKIIEAAGIAVLVGALSGLLVALLISVRLRRIADAASALEAGDFSRKLHPGFGDELGQLARAVERMRERLAASFTAVETDRDRLERILARLNEGVISVHRSLTVAFANPQAARLLGAPVETGARIPDPWRAFSLPEFVSSLFEAESLGDKTHLVAAGGETIAVAGIAADGAETAVIVLSDVSAAERQEQAEREFVTNAAHELRTPLQTILGAVEMLQAGAKDSPDERDMFLGHIERESTRLSRLVQALLVLARAQTLQESPRLQPVELRGLLEDVAAGSRPRPGVALEVDCPPGVIALTHRDLLEQALANLASNAAKHTRSGAIRLRARETTQGIVAEVEDTGTGIAAEQRRRVAERFYRGERRGGGGFGLGLAIATQAVQAVGGSLDVQSERGRGTTVRIVLPAAAERVA